MAPYAAATRQADQCQGQEGSSPSSSLQPIGKAQYIREKPKIAPIIHMATVPYRFRQHCGKS